jgi:hypothetical protein
MGTGGAGSGTEAAGGSGGGGADLPPVKTQATKPTATRPARATKPIHVPRAEGGRETAFVILRVSRGLSARLSGAGVSVGGPDGHRMIEQFQQ